MREELRALPRSTFALGAVIVVLGLFAPLAAFAYGGEGGTSETLIFTWLVAELVVGIVVASRVASARRSRFVDSLYTTPLEQRTWFAAQAIVGCVLAALVIVAQLPFLLLQVAYLGVPAMLPQLLLGAFLMGAFAVALGLFCGVAVGESGPGAGAGLAGGIAFLSFIVFLFHGMALESPPSPTQSLMLRATALSPLSLVIDATDVGIFGTVPTSVWRPFAGIAGMIVGLGVAAWLAYTRAQGPLGWEARSRVPRALVVALVAMAIVTPVASAEVTFREADDGDGSTFSFGEHTQVAFVPRGAPVHDESFTFSSIYLAPELPLNEPVELDALVLLDVPEGTVVRAVRIEVRGGSMARVDAGGVLSVPDGATSERAPPGEGWQTTADVAPRPVYRVPVTLRAVEVHALADSEVMVEVLTRFTADGRALTSHAKVPLDAYIPGAQAQLALAGLPLPLVALASLVSRKLRTR